MQQAAIGILHQRNGPGQIGHIERTGDAIEHGHADQEQRRRCQIDGNVVKTGLNACAAGAMQQQTVRGCQHDLEEHEQIEQVRRDEGTAEPHQLQLEQGVEVHPGLVPARRRKHQCGQCHHIGDQQHQGGEPIQRQRDAEGRRPVAGHVDRHGDGRARLVGPAQQHDHDHQTDRGGQDVHAQLQALALLAQEQHQRCRQHGQHDGGQHQVRHQTLNPLAHSISCSVRECAPSTWSLPEAPRDASSTTRNSAVMAKPMTMAVSTRA